MTHYAPDKCVITHGCEGRLSPSGFTSDGSSTLSVPPAGLSNWQQRGTEQQPIRNLQDEVLLDTSTGVNRQMILAVNEAAYLSANPQTLMIPLVAEQQAARDFRQYTYRKEGAFNAVNGVESGAGKKVLRYNIVGANADVVEVFVDGVKRNRGAGVSDYQLYDATPASAVPPNTILFNSVVASSTAQVDVIVTKVAEQSTIVLSFTRMIDDDSRVGTGAWEGVDKVSSAAFTGQTLTLFYLDFNEVTNVANDVRFRLDTSQPILADSSTIQPSDIVMLLTVSGLNTPIDTIQSKCIRLSALTQNNGYLVSRNIDGVKRMFVTKNTLSHVFPVFKKILFNAPVLQKKKLTGNASAIAIDNEFIVGPDK